MFAAVGNDAEKKNLIDYPAAYDGVVGVAAADDSGKVGKFSEHGDYVDLAAPGLSIPRWCDATFTSYCGEAEGTSPAAAIASGSAALVWSAHPDWTANQVLRVLTDTASRDWPKDKPSNYLGYGLIRPARNLSTTRATRAPRTWTRSPIKRRQRPVPVRTRLPPLLHQARHSPRRRLQMLPLRRQDRKRNPQVTAVRCGLCSVRLRR